VNGGMWGLLKFRALEYQLQLGLSSFKKGPTKVGTLTPREN